jgi:hypothetical protein
LKQVERRIDNSCCTAEECYVQSIWNWCLQGRTGISGRLGVFVQ